MSCSRSGERSNNARRSRRAGVAFDHLEHEYVHTSEEAARVRGTIRDAHKEYDHDREHIESSGLSGINEGNPMKQLVATLLLLLAVSSFGKDRPVIKNPMKLVGKKVNVHNIPLCQPGTNTADHAHAGKLATVVSAKPTTMPAMSPEFTSRLNAEARALLDEQQKAATLLFRFEDGTKLDTCSPIGPQGLSLYLELLP
jgi:hypothetical protein